MRRDRGFSLIEAVVTLGVVAAISIAMTQLMSGAGLTLRRLSDDHRQHRATQQRLALQLAGISLGDQDQSTRVPIGDNPHFRAEEVCTNVRNALLAPPHCAAVLRRPR